MKRLSLISIILILVSLSSQAAVDTLSIPEIQGYGSSSPYVGDTISTYGVVTAAYKYGFYLQDASVDTFAGIYVYTYYPYSRRGDSVEVTGEVDEYYGMTELTGNVIENVLGAADIPSSVLLQTGDVGVEKYEEMLVSVESAQCTDDSMGYGEWQVNDGSGNVVVDDQLFYFKPELNSYYDVTGALNYSYGAFKIEPRDYRDITGPGASPLSLSIYDVQYTTDPSGDSPYLDSLVEVHGIVTGIFRDGFSIEDKDGGPWDGVYVFTSLTPHNLNRGDSCSVVGTVEEYYGFTELGNSPVRSIISSGVSIPSPLDITTSSVSEEEEGVYVYLDTAECVAESLPPSGTYYGFSDGSGDTLLVGDLYGNYVYNTGETYGIYGIIKTDTFNFVLEPRDSSDIISFEPEITNVNQQPEYPSADDTVIVSTTITDNGSITSDFLYYNVNGGTWNSATHDSVNSSNYYYHIDPYSEGDTVQYYIWAQDNSGIEDSTKVYSYVVGDTLIEFRVAAYNSLNFSHDDTNRVGYFQTVFDSMDADVILMQEIIDEGGCDTLLNRLNSGGVEYARATFIDGPGTDNMLFYRTSICYLISQHQISTDLRDISEYVVEIGNNTVRLYSCHLKASSGSSNEQQRLAECTTLRNYLNDSIPDGEEFIVAGDMNFYYDEPAYYKLIDSETNNNGRCWDPLEQPGDWHENSNYASIHTQSTRTTQFGGGASGGLDDRFDFVFTKYGINDGSGIEYDNRYISYGNDGNHFDIAINDGTNDSVSALVANALHEATDHLPVYADFLSIVGGQSVVNREEEVENPLLKITENNRKSVSLEYAIPDEGSVKINVYNVVGQEIKELVNEVKTEGLYSIQWHLKNHRENKVPGGIYFIRMKTGSYVNAQKVYVIK